MPTTTVERLFVEIENYERQFLDINLYVWMEQCRLKNEAKLLIISIIQKFVTVFF